MPPFNTTFMYEVACAAVCPALRSNQALQQDLHQLASSIFGSFGQTKVVEDVFKRFRRREDKGQHLQEASAKQCLEHRL